MSEGQAKSERSTGKTNKLERERSFSTAFNIVLKLEPLKLKFGIVQFDS